MKRQKICASLFFILGFVFLGLFFLKTQAASTQEVDSCLEKTVQKAAQNYQEKVDALVSSEQQGQEESGLDAAMKAVATQSLAKKIASEILENSCGLKIDSLDALQKLRSEIDRADGVLQKEDGVIGFAKSAYLSLGMVLHSRFELLFEAVEKSSDDEFSILLSQFIQTPSAGDEYFEQHLRYVRELEKWGVDQAVMNTLGGRYIRFGELERTTRRFFLIHAAIRASVGFVETWQFSRLENLISHPGVPQILITNFVAQFAPKNIDPTFYFDIFDNTDHQELTTAERSFLQLSVMYKKPYVDGETAAARAALQELSLTQRLPEVDKDYERVKTIWMDEDASILKRRLASVSMALSPTVSAQQKVDDLVQGLLLGETSFLAPTTFALLHGFVSTGDDIQMVEAIFEIQERYEYLPPETVALIRREFYILQAAFGLQTEAMLR